MTMYITLGISVLMIILGFIALLKQKIYIDADTQKATEIDIPILGKMKTNYPSLVFIFLGVLIIFYSIEKFHPPPLVEWKIEGTFVTSDSNFDWYNGQLSLFPKNIDAEVRSNGKFVITLDIEKGKTFEDVVEWIDYSHQAGSIKIIPANEWQAHNSGKPNSIQNQTSHSRTYKNIELVALPKPKPPN